MSDSTPNTTRPWTPGPWEWRDLEVVPSGGIRFASSDVLEGGDGTPVVWSNVSMTSTQEDAALVALAPVMAEAILVVSLWHETAEKPCDCSPCRVADKLRQIGAKCIDGSCCDDEGCRARLGEDAHA